MAEKYHVILLSSIIIVRLYKLRFRLKHTTSEKMWSSLITPTFLFLSFFSVELAPNPGSATDEDDSYPPFWDQINGDITEFPVQNNKTIIDPWKYIGRLRMYKILIKNSNRYFAGFGKNKTDNVLWALTLYYGKLYETGTYILILSKKCCFFPSSLLRVSLELICLNVIIWIFMKYSI